MINDCVSVNNRALAESLAVPDLESSQISEAWLVTLVNMVRIFRSERQYGKRYCSVPRLNFIPGSSAQKSPYLRSRNLSQFPHYQASRVRCLVSIHECLHIWVASPPFFHLIPDGRAQITLMRLTDLGGHFPSGLGRPCPCLSGKEGHHEGRW
ncbi:hypothetical protein BJV77DRAFT_391344 [Russula vinacea]|nr:hypothetical protein BJV77DRAFT_391344 [Russula vinacea]